jgi:Ger(x)C family germination protein
MEQLTVVGSCLEGCKVRDMKRLRYLQLLGMLFLMVFLLSGCWDINPIEDRALALLIGIDRNANVFQLSAQIPTIKNLIQTASSSSNREKPVFKPLVVESTSLIDCVQQFEDRTYQSVVMGSVKVIVISPRIASLDVMNILTLFLRHSMVSSQTLVFCSEDSPAEIVKFGAPLEIQPGLTIYKQLRSPLKLARSFPTELWDFIARVDNKTIDPYLPIIKLDQDNKSYILEGINVFSHDKLAGSLNSDESYIFGALTGKVEKSYKEITFNNQKVGFHQVAFKPHIKVIKHGAENTILLKINTVGTLFEIPPGISDDVQTFKQIKIALEKQLEKEIMFVVKRLQTLNSDPVGFRKYLEVAGVKNWRAVYRNIPVKIKVNFSYLNLPKAH